MEKFDFVILGAGVAGLSFAKKVSERGFSVLILEKENVVGGLSRTLNHNGFLLDFCAHRFHSKNEEVLKEVFGLDMTWKKHLKKSRVYIYNKYLKYPYEVQNLLRAMPLHESFLCGLSFLKAQLIRPFPKERIKSYRDWFVYFYGEHMYNYMMRNYTEKIWHMDPKYLSADWADQRFQGLKIRQLITQTLVKISKLDFKPTPLEDELYPDAAPFYYPKAGAQRIPDRLLAESEKSAAQVLTQIKVARINRLPKHPEITFEYQDNQYQVSTDYILSTIPLHTTVSLVSHRPPKSVKLALKRTRYMNIIFVNLILNKPKINHNNKNIDGTVHQ